MHSLKCIFISAPRGSIGAKPGRAMSLTPTMKLLLPQMARYMRLQEEGRAIRRIRR